MHRTIHEERGGAGRLSRRGWLKSASVGAVGLSGAGWLQALAADAAEDAGRRGSCILLWMSGGPSQIDTFDMKPGHENGGPFQEIDTAVPGIRISEHLGDLAKWTSRMAVVRSMSTKEGDHSRATYHLRTGYLPQGPIRHPTLGSAISKELGSGDSELPDFVSIAPYRFLSPNAYGPGFLGPRHAPLVVGGADYGPTYGDGSSLAVRNLARAEGVDREQADARLEILRNLERDFRADHPGELPRSHEAAYQQAVRLMRGKAAGIFELSSESDGLRDAYGRNQFGQGCLLARRLVQHGVPFVEVSLNGVEGGQSFGWDTHTQNFEDTQKLCEVLAPAWAALMKDLADHGLLETTTIVWMGEFGRTPTINIAQGRDHYPAAWSAVLAGGGVQGGGAVGRTSRDGSRVEDRPVSVGDLLATVCHAVGVDPMKQNMSRVGRPIRIVDPEARPIEEVLS